MDGGLPAEWHVYVVRAADGTLYTGIATDVDRRLAEHAGKLAAYGVGNFRGTWVLSPCSEGAPAGHAHVHRAVEHAASPRAVGVERRPLPAEGGQRSPPLLGPGHGRRPAHQHRTVLPGMDQDVWREHRSVDHTSAVDPGQKLEHSLRYPGHDPSVDTQRPGLPDIDEGVREPRQVLEHGAESLTMALAVYRPHRDGPRQQPREVFRPLGRAGVQKLQQARLSPEQVAIRASAKHLDHDTLAKPSHPARSKHVAAVTARDSALDQVRPPTDV